MAEYRSGTESVENPLAGRELLVGVSGGVAAYKSAQFVSRLVQAGAGVSVVLTEAAERFVGRATFAALSARPVATDLFDAAFPLGAHIELAARAELLVVAPATADFLARAATGRGDDLLSTLYLCFRGPVVCAPAMNTAMWEHPAVRRNVEQLQRDGVVMVPPEAGWLSCRQAGAGRLPDPEQLLAAVAEALPGRFDEG